MGGRRMAALANIASVDEATALVHNPGALADIPGTTLYLSNVMVFVETQFWLRQLDETRYPELNPPGCGTAGHAPCPWPVGPDGFYTKPIVPEANVGILPYAAVTSDLARWGRRDIVVGLALYLPGFFGAVLPADAPSQYNFISGNFAMGTATFGASWRINDKIAVGGTLSYNLMRMAFTRRMSLISTLTDLVSVPGLEAETAQLLLGDITVDFTGIDHGMSWGLGLKITPLPWLILGFNYSGSTPAQYDGGVSFSAQRNPSQLPVLLDTAGVKLPTALKIKIEIPHSLGVGFTVIPHRQVEISVDARFWLYQLLDDLKVTPVYDAKQPGREVIDAASLTQTNFYDLSYEFGIGVLVRPLRTLPKLEVMAGFSYDKSPVEDPAFSLSSPSMSSYNLSFGVRYTFAGRWRLLASYLLYELIERDIRNSVSQPPSNGRGAGRSHLPSLELQYTF